MNKTTYWIVLAAAILVDVITGLIKAVYTHTFQSRIMREGLFHKVGELLAGGYQPDAPAAIVYKASWPEEKVCRCTVGTLEQTAKENGITKTALITVGGFLESDFTRSRLYDPAFGTEYREVKT